MRVSKVILFIFTVVITLLNGQYSYADLWPRTLVGADGQSLTLSQAPKRILSTSVTVTGTLLAIKAPVVASASDINGKFFSQWRNVAIQRKVQNLWPAGRINLEAAYTVAPDLIIVSKTGADSAMAHIELLKAIAPVLVVDYGSYNWQTLANSIGQAIGMEVEANQLIENFEQQIKQVNENIAVPSGKVNIISYNGSGMANPVGTDTGSHGSLLTSLGFTLESPPNKWDASFARSGDFIRVEFEQLTQLQAQSTFLLRRAPEDTAGFLSEPILQNLPSVKQKQVWGLGSNSFRIDYYSAVEVLNNIKTIFTP
ncbi:MAG: Fe2+-enterobactin ABC transporter substrate-binding protein [Paraglaciecola sp.]|uniref:Fe2+-enterobactin ABC transporter substrate-binding protein n=1 Tax=Paraglaciecola sp. TaxID=1920173 RepID=UPI0032975549